MAAHTGYIYTHFSVCRWGFQIGGVYWMQATLKRLFY